MEMKAVDQLLSQLRAAESLAKGAGPAADGGAGDFAQVFQAMTGQVNGQQIDAEKMAKAFSAGDPNVNLHEVMASLQKANISFQAMTQVRNKLVSAYQEIMSTQV